MPDSRTSLPGTGAVTCDAGQPPEAIRPDLRFVAVSSLPISDYALLSTGTDPALVNSAGSIE